MILLLDIGNTRIKYAISDGEAILHAGAHVHEKQWPLAISQIDLESGNDIEQCLIASVMSDEDNQLIAETLSNDCSLEANFLKTQKFQCGLENAYTNPDSMGVDRWLAMIAAWNATQRATLVIGCGTALTLDLIDDKGRHQGGYIIPGIQLMRNALRQNTAKVQANDSLMPDWYWGKSTEQCVNAGSLLSVISVIDRAIVNAEIDHVQGVECILSGGDAPLVQANLRKKVIYQPDLVFQGMLNVYAESKGC